MMNSALTFPRLLGLALGVVAASIAEPARAGETYICNDGRSVTVELADLERMKRENDCVAAYYRTAGRANAAAAQTGTAHTAEPSPLLKPRVVEKPARQGPEQVADFRRVRILNAKGSKPAYFVHSR